MLSSYQTKGYGTCPNPVKDFGETSYPTVGRVYG